MSSNGTICIAKTKDLALKAAIRRFQMNANSIVSCTH